MSLMPLGYLSQGGEAAAAFELISTTVLASTATSVTFSLTAGQQASYKHLQVRTLIRNDYAGSEVQTKLTFNSDTAANYVTHGIYGTGSGSPAAFYTAPNYIDMYDIANNMTADSFGAKIIDIVDAFSTSKNKTVRLLNGYTSATTSRVSLWSGLWLSTAAVSSITLTTMNNNFMVGSRFSLYGVKGE